MRVAFCSLGGMFGLLLLMMDPGQQPVESFQAQVECVCTNNEYVTCDWGSKWKPDANYSLYFWYGGSEDSKAECRNYTQIDGLNVGCWFSEYQLFSSFYTYLNASQGRTISMEPLLLNNQVRPGRPFNLTIHSVGKHQLNLTWKSPYKKLWCLEHAVRYKSNRDMEWMEHQVSGLEFQLPSVDPEKLYTFYVRSKINNNCGTTKDLWSQPSEAAMWGKEGPSFLVQEVLFPLGSVFTLLILLLALISIERVRLVLLPRIPNPGKKFEDLFTAYQGNFSEWAGVPKDALETFKPNYYESICSVTELLPSGGYLPVLSDAAGKAGGPPGVLADPAPTAEAETAGLVL